MAQQSTHSPASITWLGPSPESTTDEEKKEREEEPEGEPSY